jgi:hypothetical protein
MKDEALKLALEALENSIDLVSNEARNAEELYGKYPTRLARIQGLVALEVAHEKAITAIKQALAAPVQEPYGQVTVVKKPGCVDMHWFYRWPDPPYLDNAAECHTLYTNPPAAPVQEPVCAMCKSTHGKWSWMCGRCLLIHDKQPPAAQRQWVGLTDEDIDQGLLRSDYALQTAHAWRAGVVFAMTKLKEKNGL